jgi:multisubunit Na+/H+ antiporter MnhE subunit
MVTLTPGTTSLHVSDDRSTLYVHVMNVSDDTVAQTKEGFEAMCATGAAMTRTRHPECRQR